MMTKIFLVILYLIILPIALGIISNFVLRRGGSLGERRLITRLLDDYVSGFIVMFFAFEVAGLYILNIIDSLSAFIDTMTGYINIFVIVSFVVAIAFIIVVAILKGIKGQLVDELKSIRPIKSDIIVIAFIVCYISISVLFIMPGLKDDTFLNIMYMQKDDTIAVYNHLSGVQISDVQGATKLIDIFYLVLAHVIGFDYIQFILVPVNVCLLVMFFGIYKRIEWIFFGYNKKLSKYKMWTEYLFVGICVVLLFVDGSLNVSIPQNVWNGTTLLSALIMPLCFAYGYAFVCEVCNGKILRALVWVILIVVMMPVAALMGNVGSQCVVVILGIAIIAVIIVSVINLVKRKKG